MYDRVMSHIYLSHVTYRTESRHTWLSHVTHMTWSCPVYEWVMSRIWMSYVTYMNESCHAYSWVTSRVFMSHVMYMTWSCHVYESVVCHRRPACTGWRRPIGCLKLQVIFCKRATNYRALLQKMTYQDKASYASLPPCRCFLVDSRNLSHTHNISVPLARSLACSPSLSFALSLALSFSRARFFSLPFVPSFFLSPPPPSLPPPPFLHLLTTPTAPPRPPRVHIYVYLWTIWMNHYIQYKWIMSHRRPAYSRVLIDSRQNPHHALHASLEFARYVHQSGVRGRIGHDTGRAWTSCRFRER